MWFYVTNGELNLCFEKFYDRLVSSKLIFLIFRDIDIISEPEVMDFVSNAFLSNNENEMSFIKSIPFIGCGLIKVYLYETLFSKIYSEYECFIKDLTWYINNYRKPNFSNFEQHVKFFKEKVSDKDIWGILDKIDDCRVVRNSIVHNYSEIDEHMGNCKRNRIQNVTPIIDEMYPKEFVEISEQNVLKLYDDIEDLLYMIRDYFIVNSKLFRIK